MDVLPEIKPLLGDERLNELGPGSPNLAIKPLLLELARKLPTLAKERESASACLAGLWLYHDFFDESHAISQDLDTPEGSYWHGILHRREPDFGNAKYWFRRVPGHAIFATLCTRAAELTQEAKVPTGSEFLVGQRAWDPFAFIDLCEKASHGPELLTQLCRRIQQCEWELLFQHCHERAFGR
jgi:hypothetical protein